MNKFLFVGVLLSLSVSLCVAEEWGMMVNEAIQASECEYFNAGTGKYYDLSPMIRTTAPDYQKETSAGTFNVNICAATSTKCNTPQGVCQTTQSGGAFGCGSASFMSWSPYSANPATDGVTIKYTNGDKCGFTPRESLISISCDKNANQGVIDAVSEPSTCVYSILMRSRYACGNKNPGGNNNNNGGDTDGGLDVGWILIIVVFCLLVVYLIAGVAIKYKKYEARGLELIPNIDFWKAFPFLVKDGIFFTVQKVSCGKVLQDWSPSS